jgi:signal transduction histidine kinase
MEQRTLLIIDDSTEDRATVARYVAHDPKCEYRIVEAAGVAEGLARVADSKPDCVVLDDFMADGNALDFLRSARGEDERVPFPVVIFTGAADPEAAVALMKAGAHDYLTKSDPAANAMRLAVDKAIFKVQSERRLEEQRAESRRLYEEAHAANAAKDDFLAMLSHELRTPLTPVLSLVSTAALDPTLAPDLRETFAMIQRNVELEARLIDDLLDLTQIASGRLKIDRVPVDVHRCIEAALDVCQVGFEEKRITVRTELAAPRSVVLGDFARLNQVLWNLLKNAVKFTGPHGHVTITTANESDAVHIEIRDDGMGIEPSRLASIFGAFSPIRPQPTATGIGLGLAITRAIVEGHGGHIRAQSDGQGRGAIFHICLPTSEVDVPAGHAQPRLPVAGVRGKTILVVEDHEDTRRALSRALRRRGFGVTAAGSVSAACEQYLAAPADLLVCDIGLPDGTGWNLMEKLRAHGPVRAIAVSGYGMDQDIEKSRAAGFVAHLTKPIDFPKLESLIVQNLSGGAPGASAFTQPPGVPAPKTQA